MRPSVLCLWVIGVVTVGIEIVLSGADAGLWGHPVWRALAVQNGGLWPGLLRSWQPNYPGQPAAMFATYALLHVSAGHLAGNLLAAVWLGHNLTWLTGYRTMLVVYGAGALGGGLLYALMPTGAAPVVGASGAVFGLAGAWLVLEVRERRAKGLRGRQFVLPVLGIAALVGVFGALGLVTGQAAAWQAHLGGALAGGGVAALWPPRRGAGTGTPT